MATNNNSQVNDFDIEEGGYEEYNPMFTRNPHNLPAPETARLTWVMAPMGWEKGQPLDSDECFRQYLTVSKDITREAIMAFLRGLAGISLRPIGQFTLLKFSQVKFDSNQPFPYEERRMLPFEISRRERAIANQQANGTGYNGRRSNREHYNDNSGPTQQQGNRRTYVV